MLRNTAAGRKTYREREREREGKTNGRWEDEKQWERQEESHGKRDTGREGGAERERIFSSKPFTLRNSVHDLIQRKHIHHKHPLSVTLTSGDNTLVCFSAISCSSTHNSGEMLTTILSWKICVIRCHITKIYRFKTLFEFTKKMYILNYQATFIVPFNHHTGTKKSLS